MMPHTATATLSGVKAPRPSARHDAPVLIQAPALPVGDASARGRTRRSFNPAPARGRRRLRREVRVAASTLLVAVPLTWALFAYANLGPARAGDPEPTSRPADSARVLARANAPDDEPRVTIGLHLPGSSPLAAPAAEFDTPRVVPAGYLLPDDGPEETAHAGH